MATKMARHRWLLLAILCAFGSISLVGCGGVRRIPVAGTVTLDGQPLNGGILVLSPDTSKGNMLQINCTSPVKEGRYELKTSAIARSDSGAGVPPGWYKVTFETPHLGGRKQPMPNVAIPDKYMSVEKTPLEVEVKDNPEPGAYDFKLTK